MERPQFFKDLDRSLAGEPEESEPPKVRVQAVTRQYENVQAANNAYLAQAAYARAMFDACRGVENTTATGAMIAAAMAPRIVYDPRLTPEQRRAGYAFGSVWDALGLK